MDIETLAELPTWEWPRNAREIILRSLLSSGEDPARPVLAAELAGSLTVMNDDLARALVAAIRDPGESPSLRATAAISLGPLLEEADLQERGDPYALASEDPDLLWQAVRTAGGGGVPGAWPRIRLVLLDPLPDRPLLLAAIEAAATVGGPRDEVDEALANLDDSDDPDIAEAAVAAMNELGLWGGLDEDGEDAADDRW